MGTAELIALALKLFAAGVNEAFILKQISDRESAGQTPRQIGEWLSKACDTLLEPIPVPPGA